MSDGSNGPVPVRGIKADDATKPPSRLELRQLKSTNADQWNLFLLGMERFMDPTKEDDPLSYYQISGIHGQPYGKWPDKSWNKEVPLTGRGQTGYCTHSSVLFLTWHRPYLALYEQTLYKHVNDIAQSYGPEPAERKAAYVQAAKTFRMPYWDWALQTTADLTLFPKEVWASTIPSVIRPRSQGKSVPMQANPLASYQFGSRGKSDSNGTINRFPNAGRTLRWPDRSGTSSDERAVKSNLRDFAAGQDAQQWSRGKNLTERVFWILTAYSNYGAMCCNLFPSKEPNWNGWGSLEDIHNSVHSYVGGWTNGGGHMGGIAVSAFDPVFWLHHTNIDRLFAIWQTLHSDYVTSDPSGRSGGTRVIAPGSGQDTNTPLPPFNTSEKIGDYWSSETAKKTKDFGYVYPETRDWVYRTKEETTAQLRTLYGWASLSAAPTDSTSSLSSRARLHSLAVEAPTNAQALLKASDDKLPAELEQKIASIKISDDRKPEDLIVNNKYLEWLVDIKAEKHANNGDFVVHVFLGQPEDENPALYIFNHNHVASFSTLGQSIETGCDKCQNDQADRTQVTGQIPLTLALAERYQAGLVGGLAPEIVEPYLAQNLHWRVVNQNAEFVPRDQINGLLVGVVTCEVTLATTPGGLPQYASNVVPRPAATTRRREDWSGEQPEGRGDGTGYCGGELGVAA